MRVVVVAEYYPSDDAPAHGIWAHRQALAARDAGADVRVLVLHRALPTTAQVRVRGASAFADALAVPRRELRDGLEVRRAFFPAPPRPWSYGSWGALAAPAAALALRRLRAQRPYDVVHAHYAAPAGFAVLAARPGAPVVVSVHGGDVLAVVRDWPRAGGASVRRALRGARLVLANSEGIARRCRALGAASARVLHLGTDLPPEPAPAPGVPRLVTVGNLVARKRHRDVLEALAELAPKHPALTWEVVGDGPEREALERRAAALGLTQRVIFRGALPHPEAVAAARTASLFVLPSVEEAFGVAYVEAMAAGVPALGCRGEPGPEEIARAGGGIELVPARDPAGLAAAIGSLLADAPRRAALGRVARATVERAFTWELCGRETVAAYGEALA